MLPAHGKSLLTQASSPYNASPRAGLGARPRTLLLYILTFLLLAAAVVGFIGYDLRVLVDPAKTLFRLVTQERVTTRTGETILVRRERNNLVYFSPLRHVPADSLNRRFPPSAALLPARLALEGRETFIEYNDYRGVPLLAATRDIPLAGWGMVRKIGRAEALADFGWQVIVETLAAVLLLILLGGLLLFHRREVVTAVLKREGAKFRALFKLAPDAIYVFEPSTLRIQATEAELADRLRFETLLAELSARFVNVPAQQFDDEIEDAQRRVCECLGLEASSLWQVSAENPSFVTQTHFYRPLGDPPLPERMDPEEYFPWCSKQFMAGKANAIAFSSLEEVPAEAARDRESWRQFSIKSLLAIPLSVGGWPPVGALCFHTMRAERIWSEEIVNRLQLVAQMFSNALARQRSDRALRESEGRYRALFENAPVGIYRTTPEGRILAANPVIVQMLGYSSFEELAARNLSIEGFDLEHPRSQFRELVERQGEVTGLESAWRRRDGSIVHVRENARISRDDSGKVVYYEGTVEDITPQKEAQQRQDLTVRVLDILNRAGSLSGMIGEILRVVKEHTGLDAVGIRLREGEDYPYFVQEGFSKGFVEKENYLCSRTPEGALRRDERGQAILECACGLVLGGRTDPANPLFTVGGSFWTNRSSRLLELSAEQDPRRYSRNRCIFEGYESVALIPIRVGREIAGLLQLDDRRPERFTVDNIRFFEGIGASIGLALARQREAEALRQSEQFNREVISNAQEGVMVYDPEFRYLVWNRFMEELTGMPAAQVLGKNGFDLFPHLREQNLEPLLRRALAGETVQTHDARFYVRETGKSGWVSNTYGPHFGPDGKIIGVVAIVREISKRKQAEEEMRQALEQLRALAARLQTIREEERTRVARDIHDRLGQALTAIKLDLSSLARGFTAEQSQQWKRASSILRLVDQMIQSVRRISTELRPGMLDDLGLVATVEWATREFAARTGTKCFLDLPEEHIALDPETATAVFRILQETLTNVGRHANASEVKVRLAKQDRDLTLEVHDNGRGITQGEISSAGSLGILGMRERALLLGGEVNVSGAPGKGTTVSVRIPSACRKERE